MIPSPDTDTEGPGSGWIDPEYFNNYIVPNDRNQVYKNKTWFIYLFHSLCRSGKCQKLNHAYDQIHEDWVALKNMRL